MTEHLTPSLEKMNFSLFQRHFVSYRLSQIPNLILNLSDSKFQLPDRSSLHVVNHFLDHDPAAGIEPDLTNPLIQNETWRKFLKFELSVSGPDTTPYPVADRYTYMPGRYRGMIPHFFNQHKEVHNIISDDMIDKAPNILAIHEYSALLKMQVTGRLHDYRKFDILMRTILNKIANTNYPRYHFIMLPLSDTLYKRSDYLQAFSRIDQSSLRNRTDFSFFLEVHLLGMIYGETTKLSVTPSAYDVQYWDKHDQLPQAEYASTHEEDEPEEEGEDSEPEAKSTLSSKEILAQSQNSTSLFERLDQGLSDRTFLVLTHGGHAIVYNLGDIKTFSSSASLFNKVIRHINSLKLVGSQKFSNTDLDKMDDETFDTVVDQHSDDPTQVEKAPPQTSTPQESETPETPQDKAIVKPQTPSPTTPEPLKITPPPKESDTDKSLPQQTIFTPFMSSVHDGLEQTVKQTPVSQSSQEARMHKLYEKHMHVKIGGKTLAEHLNPPTTSVASNTLDFLEKDLPDPAMAKSTIANYDDDYMKTLHYHDMARTLTSLMKEGMFVTDIKEESVHDQFNRYTSYRVKLVSTDGKQHSLNYKLPYVDDNGFMLVNGVKSKMIKQQVNLPICKVSPTRVNLASNYNKCLVERTTTKANSFSVWIVKYLSGLKKLDLITLGYGDLPVTERVLPYEYSAIAQSFLSITFGDWKFNLDYPHRFSSDDVSVTESLSANEIKKLESLEFKYGTYCGTGPDNTSLFWDMKDRIHRVTSTGKHLDSVVHFVALLDSLFGKEYPLPDMVAEWTELKLLDAVLPVVFVLGYEYGLSNILKLINLEYRFVPQGKRPVMNKDEIKVPFSDGSLIFSRYPLVKSLVAAGLRKFDTSRYSFISMDTPDAYYALLNDKGIRINYLKGVTSFFKFFIDPITMDVLEHMKEPTNVRDLLLRATEMLSTMEHLPAASLAHHRLRGYERLSGNLYNTVTRALAQYQNSKNPRAVLSINPEEVFMRTMADNTVQNVESINPIHEMKNNTQMTFSGSGGRTSQSFVVNDRQYPDDGVGVMSEATPDSGKVAMTVYTSANPRLTNMRGMYVSNTGDDNLDPSQVLSVASNLMPGVTQDDGKRANYVAIQLTHHVPCDNGEISRVRTGYEMVIAHRSSDTFAVTAREDGTVVDIDTKLNLVKVQYKDTPVPTAGAITLPYTTTALTTYYTSKSPVRILVKSTDISKYALGTVFKVDPKKNATVTSQERVADIKSLDKDLITKYKDVIAAVSKGDADAVYVVYLTLTDPVQPGDVDIYSFGDKYSFVSGSYLKQPLVLNVEKGEAFHRGDVLVFNSGFFDPVPGSKQVGWKHGVPATIAIMEKGETLEDGCLISKHLGDELKMSPAHVRTISFPNDTAVKDVLSVGEEVESTDLLCILEEGDLDALTMTDDPDTIAFLGELNRKAPRAKYHGHIADVQVFYAGEFEHLHPSIQDLVRKVEKKNRAIQAALKGSVKDGLYKNTTKVNPGLKYHGVEFDATTVVIEFTINETIGCSAGDKLVVANANKTVISGVMEKQFYTESKLPVDMVFSATSLYNRIVMSPFIWGILTRISEKMENDILDMYFE